jgi:diaminopimelate epimerase
MGATTHPTVTITIAKHHGLGNDFLVAFDVDLPDGLADDPDKLAELARRLCDRRRGVGADGLLIAWQGSDENVDATMTLHNADGTVAEMSGNGIRCFVQAVAMRRGSTIVEQEWRIATDAGLRTVGVRPIDDVTIEASVDMGDIVAIDAPTNWAELGCHPDRPVLHVSTGNPHSVVGVDDVAAVDLAALGAKVPQVNLEIVEPGDEPTSVRMRVHERGAGITEACGTGACATAWAARCWGLVPASAREITVVMDGGSARVRLDHPSTGRVTLIGPAVFIGRATVTVPLHLTTSELPT